MTGKWERAAARSRLGTALAYPDDVSVVAGGRGVGAQEPGPREDARVRARRACRHAPRRRQHPQVSRAPTPGTTPYGATPSFQFQTL
jgi:hypothetical protein